MVVSYCIWFSFQVQFAKKKKKKKKRAFSRFLKWLCPRFLQGRKISKHLLHMLASEPASESCVCQSTQAGQTSATSLKVTRPRSLSADKFPHFSEVHTCVPLMIHLRFWTYKIPGRHSVCFLSHCCRWRVLSSAPTQIISSRLLFRWKTYKKQSVRWIASTDTKLAVRRLWSHLPQELLINHSLYWGKKQRNKPFISGYNILALTQFCKL